MDQQNADRIMFKEKAWLIWSGFWSRGLVAGLPREDLKDHRNGRPKYDNGRNDSVKQSLSAGVISVPFNVDQSRLCHFQTPTTFSMVNTTTHFLMHRLENEINHDLCFYYDFLIN